MLYCKKGNSRTIEILVISITVWICSLFEKWKFHIDMGGSMISANYAESRQLWRKPCFFYLVSNKVQVQYSVKEQPPFCMYNYHYTCQAFAPDNILVYTPMFKVFIIYSASQDPNHHYDFNSYRQNELPLGHRVYNSATEQWIVSIHGSTSLFPTICQQSYQI